jgi:hypothetical protein
MGTHYEVVYSLLLRDETPEDMLAEFRWHLGLSSEKPENMTVDCDVPLLSADQAGYLPGGAFAVLRRQSRGTHETWGLYSRVYWDDDTWAENWWAFGELLAKYADGDGYIGFWRDADFDTAVTEMIARGGGLEFSTRDEPRHLKRITV